MIEINSMETNVKIIPHADHRPMRKYSIRETFGLALTDDMTIDGFVESGPLTPELNPHHHFPQEETLMFLMALHAKDTMYMVGPSGTGKTEMVNQVAARLGYNVVQINFDEGTRTTELIGGMQVRDGATYFSHGLLPQAYTLPGTICLLDEVDMCPPGVSSAMQNAISAARKFLIRQTMELFHLHPQNCVIATANTKGMGDDSSLYSPSTNVQNFSFLNRFETTLVLDYLPADIEIAMLYQRFPGKKGKDDAETEKLAALQLKLVGHVVAVANKVRAAFKAGTISMPLTTRDCLNWLRKMQRLPLPMRCAKYSFLNRFPEKDAWAIDTLIRGAFIIGPGDDQTYKKKES